MGAERDGGGCQEEIGWGRVALRVGMSELNDVSCCLNCAGVLGIVGSNFVCTVVRLRSLLTDGVLYTPLPILRF